MRFGAARRRPVAHELVIESVDASFEQFYESHRTRIAQAVALSTGDAHLAEDATSEAMIKAHLRWAEVSRYKNPAGWTYRVAVNHARGWRRTILRRRTTTGAIPESADADAPIDDGHIAAAIADLPHAYRGVVVCRLFLDWSTDETAEALGIAPGTVKSRLARALQQLRDRIEDTL